jgi:uncharacterized membrane protein
VSRPTELFRPDRLLAFSDGVFGVAITLLVIDVHLPETRGSGEPVLLAGLVAMIPNLFVFAFTFVVVGMSWLGHHRKFSYVAQVDGTLLWFNLIYLMALCLVPFASGVLARHAGDPVAFALYAGVMALVDLLSAAVSAYALRAPFLVPLPALTAERRRDIIMPPLLNAVIFAAGASLALAGLPRLGHWSLLLILPGAMFFGSRDRLVGRSLPPAGQQQPRGV